MAFFENNSNFIFDFFPVFFDFSFVADVFHLVELRRLDIPREVALVDPVIFVVVRIFVVSFFFAGSERGVVDEMFRDLKCRILFEIIFGGVKSQITCVAFGSGSQIVDDMR